MTQPTPPELPADAAAQSPLHDRLVFILAPPGSAGEVVAAALRAGGAAGHEGPSDVVAPGVGPLLRNFVTSSTKARRLGAGGIAAGLAALVDADECLRALRELADALLANAGPGVVVDYSPAHALRAGFVAAIFPDARLVHVVRSPEQCIQAATGRPQQLLVDWMTGHQRILDVAAMRAVHRIHVERLRENPAVELAPLLDALNLPDPRSAIQSVESARQMQMADRRVSPSIRRLCRPTVELLRKMSSPVSVE